MALDSSKESIGCLVIDGLFRESAEPSAIVCALRSMGARAEDFALSGSEGLHRQLQLAFQRVRPKPEGSGKACVVGIGSGRVAAVALSAQLLVDRMVLDIGGDDAEGAPGPALIRQYARLRAFARRNAAFCASQVLLFGQEDAIFQSRFREAKRLMRGCDVCGVAVNHLWTNGKDPTKSGLCRFLCDGVLPKSLAENPEMCIIYE